MSNYKKYLGIIVAIFIFLLIKGIRYEVAGRIREEKRIELQQEKQKAFELSIKFAQDVNLQFEKMLENKKYSKIDDKINFIDSIEVKKIMDNIIVEKINNSVLNNTSKKEMLEHKDEIISNQKDVIKSRLYLEEAGATLNIDYIVKVETLMKEKPYFTREFQEFLSLFKDDILKMKNGTFTENDYNNLIKAEERYIQSLKRVAGAKKNIEQEACEALQSGL